MMAWGELRQLLSLLFETKIAVDGVRSHLHRTCAHLLLDTQLLEFERDPLAREFAPSVCLPEPLPTFLGFNSCPLAAPQFHRFAIPNIAAHEVSPLGCSRRHTPSGHQ
jgi:hypothetical protein